MSTIPTTPTQVDAVSSTYPYVTGTTVTPNGLPAWQFEGHGPTFVLVHGGPQPLGRQGDLFALGNRLADKGYRALCIDYHAFDPANAVDWHLSVADVEAAVAYCRKAWPADPIILVAHSYGGYPCSVAFLRDGAADGYAAVNAVCSASQLGGVGPNPPDPVALAANRPTAPVAVITGTTMPYPDPAGWQAFVDALAKAGHPGFYTACPGDHTGTLYVDSTTDTLAALAAITKHEVPPPMVTDYSILAAPRITLAVFTKVLQDAHSPIAPVAAAAYRSCADLNVDPAVALAQWRHESAYGTLGAAVPHKNPGNLRLSPGVPTVNGFAQFPTWVAGVNGYTRLISGPLYGHSANYNTVRTMPFRYAPSADHNNPAAYGQAMVTYINEYMGIKPPVKPPVPPVKPPATGVIPLAPATPLFAHEGDTGEIGHTLVQYGFTVTKDAGNGWLLGKVTAWAHGLSVPASNAGTIAIPAGTLLYAHEGDTAPVFTVITQYGFTVTRADGDWVLGTVAGWVHKS